MKASTETSKNIINVIPEKYKQYADYVNKEKMIPSIKDGLQPVQRRILLSLHMMGKSFVKTAQVLGYCMGHYHPHSEASGTAAWAVENGFADGEGQWGTNIGKEAIKPAAPRYTKIRINKFIDEYNFRYIKSVEWVENDLDPEPEYVPTPLPFCFIGNTEFSSIAFGFKPTIPLYNKKHLYSRLEFLNKLKTTEPIIVPIIKGCSIVNSKENKKQIKSLLTTGNCKLTIQCNYSIDEANKKIIINGWSPRIQWENFKNKIDKYKGYYLISKEEVGDIDESDSKGTSIALYINRKRDVEETFNKLKEAVEKCSVSTITYSIYTVDNNTMKPTSVDTFLISCYNAYKKATTKHLEDNIKRLQNRIIEYDYILLLRDHIRHCIEKTLSEEKTLKYLHTHTKIDIDIIKEILEKYKIKKLFTVSLDKKEIENAIKLLEADLLNIDNYVMNNIKIFSEN